MKIKLSSNLENVRYAIRDLVPLAKDVEGKGKEVIYLNIGDPLKYDFKTPLHIIEAMHKAALHNKNHYSESQGLKELREAIVRHEKRINNISIDPENILITQGVSEGITFLLRILLERGDNILTPSPAYPLYINVPKIYDAKAIEYKLNENNNWEPDIDDVRKKIDLNCKAITIINPNNPTGAVFTEKTIKELIDLAGEYDIPIISDEIYNQILLDDIDFKSPAELSKDVPVFVLNGFSKAYLMTGWRIGYMYLHDPSGENVKPTMNLLLKMARIRLSANILAQYGALAALEGPQDHINQINRIYKKRMEIMYKGLIETEYFTIVKPKGAFYIFPRIMKKILDGDDIKFSIDLLSTKGIFTVFGSGFGKYGKEHFRAVTLPPERDLYISVNKIKEFCQDIENNHI